VARILLSSLVGFWRLVYWPVLPDTGMLVYCSMALKVM